MRGSRFSEEQIIGVLRSTRPGPGPRRSAADMGSRARPSTSGKPSTAGSRCPRRAA